MRSEMFDKTPLTPGTCEWCGNDCDPANTTCSNSCEAQLHRLEAVQGRLVIRSLKRWRLDRNNAARQDMLSSVAPTVDRFLTNDRRRREMEGAKRRAAEAASAAKAKSAAGDSQKGASAAQPPQDEFLDGIEKRSQPDRDQE